MNDDTPNWITHGRQLVGDLREPLPTPPTLRPAVLERCGISDAYAPLDTPIGSLFVAYNGRGISLIRRTDDRAMFEQLFADRVVAQGSETSELLWRMPPIVHVSNCARELKR